LDDTVSTVTHLLAETHLHHQKVMNDFQRLAEDPAQRLLLPVPGDYFQIGIK
jgi:hypothetical protein